MIRFTFKNYTDFFVSMIASAIMYPKDRLNEYPEMAWNVGKIWDIVYFWQLTFFKRILQRLDMQPALQCKKPSFLAPNFSIINNLYIS